MTEAAANDEIWEKYERDNPGWVDELQPPPAGAGSRSTMHTADYLEPDAPDPEHLEPDYAEVDAGHIKAKARPRGAIAYQKKIHSVMRPATVAALKYEPTKADGAAFLIYGPDLETHLANVAATNKNVARAIDWISETGGDNHVLALALVTVPLALQLLRNHEPELIPKPRGFKIPFTHGKRWGTKWKIGLRLGKLREMTADPDAMIKHALSDPAVREALAKQGVHP